MKRERYYIFVKTVRTRPSKKIRFAKKTTTIYQVKSKDDSKFLETFGTMSGARYRKEELNNG
jgi:hypothetical protein